MFQTITKIVKWASMPVLLVAAVFSGLAASYEALAGFVICMGAIILVQRAVWSKEYYWATGFAATFVMFSPLFLVVKVFLLMGFACTVVFMALLAAFRAQPLSTEIP
jgi:hypothetical protein